MGLKSAIVSGLALCAAIAICVCGAPASDNEIAAGPRSEQTVRAGFSPAKLFEFNNYKTIFHKTYSGMLEELVRSKYFLSRAFRAFVSAIKYRYRGSPYYLAVNEMSDWTADEIDKSKNKALGKISEAKVFKDEESAWFDLENDLPEFLPEDVHEVEEELKRIADELERSTDNSSKSSLAGRQDGQRRQLPIEKLIDTGADAHLNPRAARKLVNRVPGNNARYEPPELQSYGLRDDQKSVRFWAIQSKRPSNPTSDFTKSVKSAIGGLNLASLNGRNAGNQLPDEVFVDLRDSGCLTLPRQQGSCGSCWAFAATTIFEYLYCIKTGKLVSFSEQYMIDCSKGYIAGSNGCNGASDQVAANFVKNFGLELRANYPYNMRENYCPYDESTDLQRTGYIRFDFTNAVGIDIDLWPEYIQNSPLWTGISISADFHEYGGGVFGWGCGQQGAHAVVVIGHGREDGHEYWLIRNSHSVGWGEGGHGKLAKSAACVLQSIGYMYATSDGRAIRPKIIRNKLNDRSVVKDHYKRTWLEEGSPHLHE